ncbi:MAG: M48 family metallopeptidase [Clostridiales bacterium]|nr:M48 family metallopeptidase [Clostridiales bacterium]
MANESSNKRDTKHRTASATDVGESSSLTPYILVRSSRKTLAIYINKNAEVEVRAPLRMPIPYIERFVLSKKDWIESRLEKRTRVNGEKAAFVLRYGDLLPLWGNEYPITAREGGRVGFDGSCFYMPPDMPSDEIKPVMIRIYRLLAKQYIQGRVEEYARIMRVSPTGVRVTGAKTRWGSCSGKKSLNFSWRLMMADKEVIDYIVVHELAHILELNHSPQFWAHVEKIVPEYKACHRKLDQLQEKLAAQDWDE